MITKTTNINKIFVKLQRDYGITNLDESTVIEWSAEALQAINAVPYYENAITLLNVKGYQANIPNDLIQILQLAKYNQDINLDCLCKQPIYKNVDNNFTFEPLIEETSCEIQETDCCNIIYTVPDFNILENNFYYKNNFTIIRLSTNSFFNSNNCEQDNPYDTCYNEYQVINNVLRFSFKTGLVALSYHRFPLDENGYPLIPDTYAYTTAIEKYILYKLSERDFFNNIPNSVGKLQKYEKDWNKYCSQAASEMMIPRGVDEMQNLSEMWLKPIQTTRNYYSFFKNQGREQQLKH